MPERGQYGEPWGHHYSNVSDTHWVCNSNGAPLSSSFKPEFASRIVACVNALDGVANPQQAVAALVEAVRGMLDATSGSFPDADETLARTYLQEALAAFPEDNT